MNYDNRGQVSLWKNPKYEPGENKPRLQGTVIAHRDIKEGETLDVALWDNKSDNEKAPVLKGKMQDKRTQDTPEHASKPDFDDEPF